MRMVSYLLPDKVAAQLDMLKQSPRGEITITAEDLRGDVNESSVNRGLKPIDPAVAVLMANRRGSVRTVRVPYAQHPTDLNHSS